MSPRDKIPSFLKLLAINAALCACVLVGIELAFGNWSAPYVPPVTVVVDRSHSYRQTLYEPPSNIRYDRDRFGLRGVHEPITDVELATVGGSTTDQRFITEGETWQDVLRSLTGLRVANAGADGMTSQGHLTSVTEWLHRIPAFRPQYYLHYIGVNDAWLGLTSELFDRPGAQAPALRKLRRRSIIAKSMETLLLRAIGPREVSHHRRITLLDDAPATMRKPAIDTTDIVKYVEGTYRPNLFKLIELHRKRSEFVIFVSQSANPGIVRWTNGEPEVSEQFPDDVRWAVALGLINRATERVCRESADICRFSDLASQVRFESRDFYDLMHATPAGTRKIGSFLAKDLAFIRAGSSFAR